MYTYKQYIYLHILTLIQQCKLYWYGLGKGHNYDDSDNNTIINIYNIHMYICIIIYKS